MEKKWTERKYHVQDNVSVELKDVKIYCNTNQLPELTFCGPYYKPHGERGLGKHYHLRFDHKLGMGVCAISVYHARVLLVHKCWTKHGYLVYHQMNKITINLLPSAPIGQ